MKYDIRLCSLAVILTITMTGCEITVEQPGNTDSSAVSSASPTVTDVAVCEQITRKIVTSSDRDEGILNSCYTPRFAALIREAAQPGDGEAPYLNYDFIMETQDMEPKSLSLGPGKVIGNKIHVPYVQAHQGSQPFTKTWVFIKQNGQWLADDLITTGREQGNGSMFQDLSQL